MITVDILIAPLRILVTALGTGVLPAENPATMIRSASTDLDEVRRTSAAATSAVQNGWHGTGSRGAVAAAERTARASTAVDELHIEWWDRGARIVLPPADEDGGRSFLARDPDGNRLRVYAAA